MNRIRVIIASKDNGDNEQVIFTEDFDSLASDWFVKGMTIDSDTVIINNLPSGFPIESNLIKDL